MPNRTGPERPAGDWRQLGRHLWAGSSLDGPIGTVEHGRRFRAIDLDGAVVGRCRTLEEAQALLADRAAPRSADEADDPALQRVS